MRTIQTETRLIVVNEISFAFKKGGQWNIVLETGTELVPEGLLEDLPFPVTEQGVFINPRKVIKIEFGQTCSIYTKAGRVSNVKTSEANSIVDEIRKAKQ